MRRLAAALAAALALTLPAQGHDGAHPPHTGAAEGPAPAPLPFPVEIRLAFDLVDQTGRRVTESDFAGRPLVLFFGYARCESICDVALPMVGAALTALGERAASVTPVMITVDPERDTPAALAAARAPFRIEVTEVARDAAGDPILAHGSMVYLVGPDGRVRSALPPILAPERLAKLILRHL